MILVIQSGQTVLFFKNVFFYAGLVMPIKIK